MNAPIILEEDVPEKPTPGQEAPPAVQNPPGTETVPPGLGNQPRLNLTREVDRPGGSNFETREAGNQSPTDRTENNLKIVLRIDK